MSSKTQESINELWKAHGLQLFGLKPLNANEAEEEEEMQEDEVAEEEDNLDLQEDDNTGKSNELSAEQVQEVLSLNETLQQQVANLQQLVVNLSQNQPVQSQGTQTEEKPKNGFQMPSLDMAALGDLTDEEQVFARVMAKILPGYLKASIEPVITQVSNLEEKHGKLETSNEQGRINSEVNRVFSTYPDAFTLQNKMIVLANNARYAHISKDPELLYFVAKGQASVGQVKPKPQPKRMGGGKPNVTQPSKVQPGKAKTPGDALKQAMDQNPEIRKRLRASEYS
jgi:hypothetical protein